MTHLLDVATKYSQAGLSILPANAETKYVPRGMSWKAYQERQPTEVELRAWFANNPDALCVVTGKVSGNLEAIDHDAAGEKFDFWCDIVEREAPGLLARLVIEKTPSGGYHIPYLVKGDVDRSRKLAQRKQIARSSNRVYFSGKGYDPIQDKDGHWYIIITLIETKGEGGLLLCDPSPGYELLQGSWTELPTLTPEERQVLIGAAIELGEYSPPVSTLSTTDFYADDDPHLPGGDYNLHGDFRSVLVAHGWVLERADRKNEYWRRPGKEKGEGHSATFDGETFYVFSTSAAPFEGSHPYRPFAVLALLEHHGDFSAAAKSLRQQGYGSLGVDPGVDISGIIGNPLTGPLSLKDLVKGHSQLRKPVIHGLLREGETMNVIAASKTGKSWLVTDLALAVAIGGKWLGMECEKGDVLLLDNELHKETSANRIPKVAKARGISVDEVGGNIFIENLRGRLQDINKLGEYFKQFKPGQFKVVILDAFYRFLPVKSDENDNGMMANLYNTLDHYAELLQCCFILIHHTSKGNQSEKSVTDVGAGAGAQSRATDTHLVLRRHETDDAVVVDGAVRSWPPLPPRVLRWTFPVWNLADDLDPDELRKEGAKRKSKEPKPEPKKWDTESFVARFIKEEPVSKSRLLEEAEQEDLSSRRVNRLLDLAVEDELVFQWRVGPTRAVGYATVTPPEGEDCDGTLREEVEVCLRAQPELTTKEVADQCGVSMRYVQQIKRLLGANKSEQGGAK